MLAFEWPSVPFMMQFNSSTTQHKTIQIVRLDYYPAVQTSVDWTRIPYIWIIVWGARFASGMCVCFTFNKNTSAARIQLRMYNIQRKQKSESIWCITVNALFLSFRCCERLSKIDMYGTQGTMSFNFVFSLAKNRKMNFLSPCRDNEHMVGKFSRARDAHHILNDKLRNWWVTLFAYKCFCLHKRHPPVLLSIWTRHTHTHAKP